MHRDGTGDERQSHVSARRALQMAQTPPLPPSRSVSLATLWLRRCGHINAVDAEWAERINMIALMTTGGAPMVPDCADVLDADRIGIPANFF